MLIGIDVGGTNIAAAVVDDLGQIHAIKSIPANIARSDSKLIFQIAELACSIAEENGHVEAVGVGFPGLVDNRKGVVLKTPNMPFSNTEFRKAFQQYWRVPVFMGNDANCAAVGEYYAGAAFGYNSALMVTLGTGIGGGLIIDGKLFTGASNGALEVGHMIIESNGRRCNCGNNGCFEQYASASALIRMAREKMQRSPGSLLWNLCGENPLEIKGKTVFQAARAEDAAAIEILEEYIGYLAVGLANLINILQPEIVCLGGGISQADDDLLLKPLRERILPYIFDKNASVRLERAALGNDAGLIGAAMLCRAV